LIDKYGVYDDAIFPVPMNYFDAPAGMSSADLDYVFYYVYILKLIRSKYYVGTTFNPGARIDNHLLGGVVGSYWTTLHPPVACVKLIPVGRLGDAQRVEEWATARMCEMFGEENVRGGGWNKVGREDIERIYRDQERGELARTVLPDPGWEILEIDLLFMPWPPAVPAARDRKEEMGPGRQQEIPEIISN
jgi:predicted GIY-YIG superfamily endonuclease